MAHSKRHGGLQAHSIGEQYPWSVAIRGNGDMWPFHCITGRRGPVFRLNTFAETHAAVEEWIARELTPDEGPYVTAMRNLADLA